MVQTQLINSVIEWERRLEVEGERRKNHRSEPYVNYLAAPQPCRTNSLIEREKGSEFEAVTGRWMGRYVGNPFAIK